MKNRGRFGKRILVYTAAAALALSAAGAGSSFVSQAGYIQYDNIVIRDAPETGNIIEGVDSGTKVSVISTKEGSDGRLWNQVRFTVDGKERVGWVRADLMSMDSSDKEKIEETKADQTNQQEKQTDQKQESQSQEKQTDQDNKEVKQTETKQEISGDGYQAGDNNTFLVGDKTLKVSSDFPDSAIPDGFSKKMVTYNGQNINMLKYNNGDLYMIWLSDGQNGEFYVLDTVRNCVIPFMQKKSGNETVTLLLPPQSGKVSSAYEKTVLMADSTHGVTAFHPTEEPGINESLDLTQFYYVYGMASDGAEGWYLFDADGNTFVRAVEDMSAESTAVSDPTESDQEISIKKMVFLSIIVVILIMLFSAIALGMKCRRLRKQIPDNADDDDELDEEFMTVSERRREQDKYRHIMDDEEENKEETEVSHDQGEEIPSEEIKEDNLSEEIKESNPLQTEQQLSDTDFTYEWLNEEEQSAEQEEESSSEEVQEPSSEKTEKSSEPEAEEIDHIAADLADLYPDGKIPDGPGYYNESEDENQDSLSDEDEKILPDEPDPDMYEEKTKEEKHKGKRRLRRKKKKDSDDEWDDVLEFLDLK